MPNFLSKFRNKFYGFNHFLRLIYYKSLGMQIGHDTSLGCIEVEWPGNIKIGNNCEIRGNSVFWVQSPFNPENTITIGDNVFIGRNTEFNCCSFIKIGNNCLIASSTVFVDSSHTFFLEEIIAKQPTKLRGITLEEDVWVGTGAKILYGVHLGKGCIVGANAVVNKSIPAYEIWAGVPAKKIGDRRSNNIVL